MPEKQKHRHVSGAVLLLNTRRGKLSADGMVAISESMRRGYYAGKLVPKKPSIMQIAAMMTTIILSFVLMSAELGAFIFSSSQS